MGVSGAVIDEFAKRGFVNSDQVEGAFGTLYHWVSAEHPRGQEARLKDYGRKLFTAERWQTIEKKIDSGDFSAKPTTFRFAHVDLAEALQDPKNFEFKGESIDAIVASMLKEYAGDYALDPSSLRTAVQSAVFDVRASDPDSPEAWDSYEQAIYRAITQATGIVI